MILNFNNNQFPSGVLSQYTKGIGSSATVNDGAVNINVTSGSYQGVSVTSVKSIDKTKKFVIEFDFNKSDYNATSLNYFEDFSFVICNRNATRDQYYGVRNANCISVMLVKNASQYGTMTLRENLSTDVQNATQLILMNTTYHVKITLDFATGLCECYLNNSLTPILSKTITSDTMMSLGTDVVFEFFQIGYTTTITTKIDNLNIGGTTEKYLIQDKNNILYTFDGTNIIQSLSQTLDDNNFKINGFLDVSLIPETIWNTKFPTNSDAKILMWTDDTSKTEAKLTYECEPFELINWLKDNECKLLAYTDDLEKKECNMIYNCDPYRPIDKLDDEFDIVMLKDKTMD